MSTIVAHIDSPHAFTLLNESVVNMHEFDPQDVLVVDIRGACEYAESHIRTAMNIVPSDPESLRPVLKDMYYRSCLVYSNDPQQAWVFASALSSSAPKYGFKVLSVSAAEFRNRFPFMFTQGSSNETNVVIYPSEILERLYLCGVKLVQNEQTLRAIGANAILNVTADEPNFFEESGVIEYRRVSVEDEREVNLIQLFDSCIEWIDSRLKRGEVVVVHCTQGCSRSASIIIAYLMKIHKMSYIEGLDWCEKRRSFINPNTGFRYQLQQYAQALGRTT